MNRTSLIAFAAMACLLAFSGVAQQITRVSPQTADSLLRHTRGLQLLDVRTSGEFAQAHLPNATNIDVRESDFTRNVARLDPKRPLLVYCLAGSRSAKAAELLARAGFEQIYDMQGGFAKWSGSGLPVEEGAQPPKASLTLADFQRLTAADKPVLVDFYAKWCAPCQKMLPVLKKLEKELAPRVQLLTIDFDQNRDLARQLGVESIPAFFLYKKGEVRWQALGEVDEATFREQIGANQ